jgi:hypothetical protein
MVPDRYRRTDPLAGLSRIPYECRLCRWCWRLDAAANQLAVWTGRLAARAVFRDMRRRGEL